MVDGTPPQPAPHRFRRLQRHRHHFMRINRTILQPARTRDRMLLPLYANAFTPNNDGVNDRFSPVLNAAATSNTWSSVCIPAGRVDVPGLPDLRPLGRHHPQRYGSAFRYLCLYSALQTGGRYRRKCNSRKYCPAAVGKNDRKISPFHIIIGQRYNIGRFFVFDYTYAFRTKK